MSSSTALGARPKAKPMPPAEDISPRQQLLRNARLALRPLHLQRLREEGLHEYLMKPKAHFVFGCPWPPGHPFGTKNEVEALKHAEKVHHYEPKTSAEGRMLSLEEFLNSFPKNQQKKKKKEEEEKEKNTVPVPSRGNLQPRTPTPRPTSRPSSTRDRPRSPSEEPPRSSTWDPPSWSTWGTPSSSTWEHKFVYMGHTKLVYMGHTKLVYMGHTKLDSCRRTRKFQLSSCISKPCSRRSPPSSQPSRRCQPCSKIKSARVS